MTPTSFILSFVLATLVALVAAVPASAADGYRSTDSLVASAEAQTTAASGDQEAKPLFAGVSESRPLGVGGGEYRSADAVLAGSGPQLSGPGQSGYVDALLRSPAASQPATMQVVRSGGGDGFHWGDALIGAAIASLMLLVMLAAARSVARHRRSTVESRA